MKTINVTLSQKLKSIEIHTFADWHIGDHFSNTMDIQKMVDVVREKENAYCILNGDLMNNATKNSVSDSYAEVLSPMEQVNYLVELLTPIKDKILMATLGNHEARTLRDDGIDLMALVMAQLGMSDKYAREGAVLFLRFGKGLHREQWYTIYCTHGSGGGRKEGAKAIRLADMASIVDCDIYIHSHTHLPMIMKQSFWRLSPQNSSVAQVDKLFVNTAAQLSYGGYGQSYEFKPSSTHTPIIYLSGGTNKHASAKL